MDQLCETATVDKKKKRKPRKRNKRGSCASQSEPEVKSVDCSSVVDPEAPLVTSNQLFEKTIEPSQAVACETHKTFEDSNQDIEQMAASGSGKKEKGYVSKLDSSPSATAPVKQQESEISVTTPVSLDKAKKDGLTKAERRAQYEALRAKEGKKDLDDDAKSKGPSIATESSEILAGGEPPKSKAQLRAERRAVQEAQRAAKGASKVVSSIPTAAQKSVPLVSKDEPTKMPTKISVAVIQQTQQQQQQPLAQKKVQFFSHLQQYQPKTLSQHSTVVLSDLHPAILRLGLQYADGVICGSNARCVAMLHALKQVIMDYTTPPNKELSRDLDEKIKPCIDFLQECRPLSVSIENAVKHLKRHISHISSLTTDDKAKKELVEEIDRYIEEHILFAGKGIAANALAKINDGDVVLVFSHSSVINNVLITAHKENKAFKVVIVDSRPKLEGHKALVSLVKHGLSCSYVMMNALSYTMQKVTKVLLGAHALLANGYVLSRVGSSQVALVAKAYNVPVLVCCETHKFCERVQTDSFVSNELGNPDDLASDCLATWRDVPSLTLLNLVYDLTPPDLISAVVTEIGGLLPCTSVPVVLRLKQTRS